MERLNDIIGRTGPRRQSPPENRPTQGQRPSQFSQTQQPRRPLPEQTARLGQRQNYGSQAHRPYVLRSRNPQGPGPQEPAHAKDQANQGYSVPDSPQSHQQSYAQQYSQPPSRQRSVPPAYSQRSYSQQEIPRPKPYAPQPVNDYYHTDDYGPGLPADVADEWQDEEDTTGMRYGDWEGDDSEDFSYQTDQREHEIEARPGTGYSSTVREAALSLDMEIRPYPPRPTPRPTRDLRNVQNRHQPVNTQIQEPQSLPAPTPYASHPAYTRTQGIQHSQRITQPLNQQVVSSMGREREQVPRPQSGQRQAPPVTQRAPVPLPITKVSALPPRSICPKCRGAGFLRIDVPFGHPNFGKPVACECKEAERKEKRRQQLRALSNLDAFYSHSFKTFNPRVPGVQEAYHIAVEYAENPSGWLLFIGPNGCGKTHLAAAIANQSLEDGAVVLFAVVPDLLDHLRAAFAPDAAEVYDQLFAKMREAELLVLDDLGAQQSSPWANEKLFQLLNYRYNMGMPTVITANPKGLQGIDERIRSRLSDVSLVTAVILDRARDYRPNHPTTR